MLGLSKAQLIGNVVKDIELNTTTGGLNVASFTLAVNTKSSKGDQTNYYDCVAFNKTAEILSQYAGKGKPLFVDGKLNTREYEAKDGSKRRVTEVVVDNFVFLGGKDDGDRPLAQHEVLDAVNDVVPEDKPVDLSEIPF